MVKWKQRRAIEFFAGIGGFACAAEQVWAGEPLQIVPIEIDRDARRVYEHNHPHKVMTREIESIDTGTLENLSADLWWLSPPCQPYSRRGNQRDTADPRAASLLHLIQQLELVRPRAIALENVAGFAESRACSLLQEALHRSGYQVKHRMLCPTEMGWPNRRPRFYLLASLDAVRDWEPLPRYTCTAAQLTRDVSFDARQCQVDESTIERFATGMDRVDLSKADCITACFGSSYGKSLLHAGSYCMEADRMRRFAPSEVARLLGFPSSFLLPDDLSYRRLWKLLGNSLSIPAVEYVLRHLESPTGA